MLLSVTLTSITVAVIIIAITYILLLLLLFCIVVTLSHGWDSFDMHLIFANKVMYNILIFQRILIQFLSYCAILHYDRKSVADFILVIFNVMLYVP